MIYGTCWMWWLRWMNGWHVMSCSRGWWRWWWWWRWRRELMINEKKIKEDFKRRRSQKNRRKKRTWTSSSPRTKLKRQWPMARMRGGVCSRSRTAGRASTVGSPTRLCTWSAVLGSGWSNSGGKSIWPIHQWDATRPWHSHCEPGMAAESGQLSCRTGENRPSRCRQTYIAEESLVVAPLRVGCSQALSRRSSLCPFCSCLILI